MESLSREQLRSDLAGMPYSKLVERHLKQHSNAHRAIAEREAISRLPAWFLPQMEKLVDEWNETGRYSEFWKADSATVFDHIMLSAQNAAVLAGAELDDEALVRVFQIITSNFAAMASQHRQLRKFAGIRKGLFG
jgi:hypothetical protein